MSERSLETGADAKLPSPERAMLDSTVTIRKPRHPVDGNLLDLLRTSRVLFYPGAGDDVSPARRFTENRGIDVIVYCDYLNTAREKVRLITCNCRRLYAHELGHRCRSDFFPETNIRRGTRPDDDNQAVIGWIAELRMARADKNAVFLYLDTEAIQTYISIWAVAGCAPHVVVVQNHTLGGLWTALCGDCLMYAAAPVLPPFLYVGDIGSEPWPHYREISKKVVDRDSMHRSKRSLWTCTIPDRINQDSPLRVLVEEQQKPQDETRRESLKRFRFPDDVRSITGIPRCS